MKHILSRWGTTLSLGLLVAGAAAVAIALNLLLLGYASADGGDPVGRFRPQLDTAGQTVHVPKSTDGSRKGRSDRQTRAGRRRRPPAPTSSPTASVRPAYGRAEQPSVATETDSQPGEKEDD